MNPFVFTDFSFTAKSGKIVSENQSSIMRGRRPPLMAPSSLKSPPDGFSKQPIDGVRKPLLDVLRCVLLVLLLLICVLSASLI